MCTRDVCRATRATHRDEEGLMESVLDVAVHETALANICGPGRISGETLTASKPRGTHTGTHAHKKKMHARTHREAHATGSPEGRGKMYGGSGAGWGRERKRTSVSNQDQFDVIVKSCFGRRHFILHNVQQDCL